MFAENQKVGCGWGRGGKMELDLKLVQNKIQKLKRKLVDT